MASSPRPETLEPFQAEVLRAFVGLDRAYLTGGAALGHFYLGHRRTLDLDLFTPDLEGLDVLTGRLEDWCRRHGATLGLERNHPACRRFLVTRPRGDAVVVDIVHDPVPQTVAVEDKPVVDGVRIDAIDDIAANKLGALLGRSETKDLVDLLFLQRAGHDPLAHLDAARERDGGVDAATLAWVLAHMPTDPSSLLLIEPLAHEDVVQFRDQLMERLERLAFPPG